MNRWFISAASVIGAAIMLGGCGGGQYVISGRAVRSDFSTVSFVSGNDSRLGGDGVPSVEVYVYRDPDKPSRKLLARGLTDADGYLTLTMDAFGAGWMDEQWMIFTYRPGYQSATAWTALPPAKSGGQLLMLLGEGRAERPPPENELIDQYERFK